MIRRTYMVEESDNANHLARQVDRLLAKGWQLQGGVAIHPALENGQTVQRWWYAQALVFEVHIPEGR